MIENLWELYGLKENPFSTSPLLVQGGVIPLDSFVGRDDQLKRLGRAFGSAGGSRIMVYGDVGVGKTSFVNVARRRAFERGFFTPFAEIAVQEEWGTYGFVLNTLSNMYSTIKLMHDRPVGDGTFKKLESLVEISVEEKSVGVSLGGWGGNYGAQRRAPQQIPVAALADFFKEAISEIRERTKRDVILHYNNLELLPEDGIKNIFGNLRDFLQTPGAHFVFVGNTNVNSIMQGIPRVSSIFSDTPIHIENLSFSEIRELLGRRVKAMEIGGDLRCIVPYGEDALEVLYSLHAGNLREILNSLSTAITEAANDRAVVLNARLVSKTLKSVVEKRYLQGLSKRPRSVLREIMRMGEATNAQLSKGMGMPSSNTSLYLKELEDQGCIYLKRRDGKNKFWGAVPQLRWLELKEEGGPAQTSMHDWPAGSPAN